MSADTPKANTNGHDLDADDESVEEKRLKEIFRRKQNVIDTRDEAKLATARNANAEHEALSAYRSAVESYVSAIQNLLNQGRGPHFWAEKQYGTVTFRAPGQPTSNGGWELPNGDTVAHQPKPRQREIVGLQTLFNAADPLQEPIQITSDVKHQPRQTHTVIATQQIGWGILDAMLIDLNTVIHEAGLSINEQTDDVAEFEYSDVL